MAERKKRQFAVLGLGTFGMSLAIALQKSGCDVIAVDNRMERVEAVADSVSYAMKANMEDENMIRSIEAKELDGVIIAAAEHLEASVMATMLAKEQGIPLVLAKAKDPLQATLLKKVGADEAIRSEYEMGKRVAQRLVSSEFFDKISLSSDCSIMEKSVPHSWVGKTLRELDVRNQFGVSVVGVRRNEQLDLNMDAATPLEKNEILILVGRDEKLDCVR